MTLSVYQDNFNFSKFVTKLLSGAQEAGLLGGLVMTGKYRPGDENICPVKPDFVFRDLLEMVNLMHP